jgi:phosphatidylinositol-3-phosphatase
MESMGTPCTMTDSGLYAVRHNPFVYFFDIESDPTLCADHDVDYGQFPADLAAGTYRFMWITPNLDDDGHDPQADPVTGLQQTDAWLMANVPAILASAAFLNGGVVFITWDEAEGRNGDDPDLIPMIVLSPRLVAPGSTDATALSHTSYTATIEDLLGMPRLPAVGSDEPTLLELLH